MRGGGDHATPASQAGQLSHHDTCGCFWTRCTGSAWISLEELSQQPDLDPLLNLLTLPVRPESELAASSQQILASRPDLDAVVLPMLMQRFPELSREEIMVIAGIPHEELRHTRAAQEWLAEGEAREAAKMTLRLLNRRCGPLSEATTAWQRSPTGFCRSTRGSSIWRWW